MNKQKQFKQLLNIVDSNREGFTIGFKTLKPYNNKKGFSIGLTNIKGKNLKLLCRKVLNIGFIGFSQITNKLFIGGSFNSQNGLYYLDLSIIENNKQKAFYLKKMFNQISIYSFKTNSCL